MYEILSKKNLAPKIQLFQVSAPPIAEKARPGQFLILIIDEKGERIPLTISDYDTKKGSVSFAFNEVGKTTKQLGLMKKRENILNITGPLGMPSDIRKYGNVLCIGGGVMIAPLLLQIKTLREAGNTVTAVIGARIKNLLFYQNEIKAASDKLYLATDDGSAGCKGLSFLKELLDMEKFDRCIAMGPVTMMKEVSELTKPHAIPTVVNLMPIMVDGMGMCGVCRVTIAGKMKFGCVDGPEFNGHEVDFDELVNRQRMFLPEERLSSLVWETVGGCECDGK